MTVRTHGRYTGYTHGCRCDPCTEAHAEYQAAARVRRAARAAEDAPHGTAGGYMNWSCRCDKCVRAYSEYRINRLATKGF